VASIRGSITVQSEVIVFASETEPLLDSAADALTDSVEVPTWHDKNSLTDPAADPNSDELSIATVCD